MKRLLSITAAIFFLFLTGTEASLATARGSDSATTAAPVKYSGTWLLNRDKSEGLTGALAGAAITLLVFQDDKRIHVEQQVKIRDRQQPSQELIWNFDGSETTADVVRPMTGTMRLKARWIEASQTLELHSSISGEDDGKEVSVTTKETWELLPGGKSLRIARTRTSPQGQQRFKLVFDKQD